MNVVRMAEYSNRDTVAALKVLLAQAMRGEVTGIALCYQEKSGGEDAVLTGSYKARPAEAASAALRLSMRIADAQGEYNSRR